jgi:non-ribosomal peptide synthetase component F
MTVRASVAQEQLWLIDRLDPGAGLYNEDFVLRIEGPLAVPALERALSRLLLRHRVLRTVFRTHRRFLHQVEHEPVAVRLTVTDLSGAPQQQRERDVLEWAREVIEAPHHLDAAPPVRYALARLGEDDHVLVLAHHHIVTDLLSFVLLVSELGVAYGAELAGEEPHLPEVADDYAAFSAWHHELLASGALDEELEIWASTLADTPAWLEVPPDRPRPPVKGSTGSLELAPLTQGASALRRFAAQERVTPFAPLLAAFAALLHQRTGREDMVVGVGSEGRPLRFGRTIGLFAAVLPVRLHVEGDMGFRALLEQARDVTLEASERQLIPISSLVNQRLASRDPSRTPLVQVILNVAPVVLDPHVLPGLRVQRLHVPRTRARFDLILNLELTERLTALVEYDTALYDAATIQRLVADFQAVLDHILRQPDAAVRSIPLAPPPVARSAVPGTMAERPDAGPNLPAAGLHALEQIVVECCEEVLEVHGLGVEDEFFAVGGHSMAAAALVDLLGQDLAVDVPLLTVFENPTLGALAAGIAARYPDVPIALQRLTELSDEEVEALARAAPEEPVPARQLFEGLTPGEEPFWLMEQLRGGGPINVLTPAFELAGPVSHAALQAAFDQVVQRHEALRTAYELGEGLAPRRRVAPTAPIAVGVLDLSGLDEARQRHEVARLERQEAERGFDLTAPPLIRPTLIVLGPGEHRLLLACHHLVVDSHAIGRVLLPEIETFYRAAVNGTSVTLPAPPAFSEVAALQQAWRSSPAAAEQAAYWRRRLAGLRELVLPGDFPRGTQDFEADGLTALVPATLLREVREVAAARRVTPFMVLTAALAGVLHEWAVARDVQILTPSDNRLQHGAVRALGCFINMLVLRFGVQPTASWSDLLDQAREVVVGAYAHQSLPLADVVQQAGLDAFFGQGRGSYVALNLLEGDFPLALEGARLTGSRILPHSEIGCDLEIFATVEPAGLRLDVRYRARMWKRATIERVAAALIEALETLVADPTGPVSSSGPSLRRASA